MACATCAQARGTGCDGRSYVPGAQDLDIRHHAKGREVLTEPGLRQVLWELANEQARRRDAIGRCFVLAHGSHGHSALAVCKPWACARHTGCRNTPKYTALVSVRTENPVQGAAGAPATTALVPLAAISCVNIDLSSVSDYARLNCKSRRTQPCASSCRTPSCSVWRPRSCSGTWIRWVRRTAPSCSPAWRQASCQLTRTAGCEAQD